MNTEFHRGRFGEYLAKAKEVAEYVWSFDLMKIGALCLRCSVSFFYVFLRNNSNWVRNVSKWYFHI